MHCPRFKFPKMRSTMPRLLNKYCADSLRYFPDIVIHVNVDHRDHLVAILMAIIGRSDPFRMGDKQARVSHLEPTCSVGCIKDTDE